MKNGDLKIEGFGLERYSRRTSRYLCKMPLFAQFLRQAQILTRHRTLAG
jgi:hypothetical protein